MSRRPNVLRRMAQAYTEYIDSAADKIARVITRQPKSTDTAASTTTGSSTTTSPTASPTAHESDPTTAIAPACFSATTIANDHSRLHNLVHYLGYSRQPPTRTIFSLAPQDTADSFRVLDDRPFGGRTEARARIVERPGEGGGAVRVLLYEGVLHPLPPFRSKGSRWIEDIIKPSTSGLVSPNTDAPSASQPAAAADMVGPTGLTTPVGMLSGFSSLSSPNYAYPDLNLTPYTHLAFRLRTDGRPYTLSLRCHERLPLVYQARIPASRQQRPAHWKEIRFEHFLTTFQGQMRTLQFALPRGRVASWGLSVTGPPGPFWLELECVEARRGLTGWELAEMTEDERQWRQEEERRKTGERFLWWLDDKEKAMVDRMERRASELGTRKEKSRQQDKADSVKKDVEEGIVQREEGEDARTRGYFEASSAPSSENTKAEQPQAQRKHRADSER